MDDCPRAGAGDARRLAQLEVGSAQGWLAWRLGIGIAADNCQVDARASAPSTASAATEHANAGVISR